MQEARAVLFRHELKHCIGNGDARALRQRLGAVLPRDTHAGGQGAYLVRSLYFDTPTDKALREKLDGVDQREKYRIRYYNHDTSFIRLERKTKRGSLGSKDSAPLTEAQCKRLLLGDIGWLRDSEHELHQALYVAMRAGLLKPRVIVDYTREAFLYPAGNVRVTLDSDIHSGLAATNFLSAQVPLVPVFGYTILEVKYDAYLPSFIQDLVQLRDVRTEAFSKYAQCRIFF